LLVRWLRSTKIDDTTAQTETTDQSDRMAIAA
jgi:hypothetical protein